MSIQTTYSNARNNFATLIDKVIDEQEVVVINRRGYDDVAMIRADELSSLIETSHLLRSPKNASRLLKSLQRAIENSEKPDSLENLRKEFGVEKR
jgi:antitoxin YefM